MKERMENFNPTLRIESIGPASIAITFDTGSANDCARSPKTFRLPSDFTEIESELDGFNDDELTEVGNKKTFVGKIKLLVKNSSGETVSLTLAQPQLWVSAKSRGPKGGKPYLFVSESDLKQTIRQGLAGALSSALALYWANEGQLNMLSRYPVNVLAGIGESSVPHEGVRLPWRMPRFRTSPEAPANDTNPTHTRFRRNLAVVIGAPLLLLAAAWLLKPASKDPVHEAVAQALNQDANSMQSQVELTKQTLLTMGLDPGKSGDVGCLAPQ